MFEASPQLRQLARALRPALGLRHADDAPEPSIALARFASDRHRVGPLLHRAWSPLADADDATTTYLERMAANNAKRELRQKAAARKFGALLDAQDIGWIEFKGWRLAEELYGESALRQSKDVDLLLAPGRVPDALELAGEHGYRIGKGGAGQSASLAMRRSRWVLRHHHEIGIVDPDMNVQIELHSRLLGYPPDGWHDPAPVAGNRANAVSLGDPDFVLYLIAHGALTGWKRLKWLCDLVMLIQRVSPEVRNAVIARARTLECESALVASLLAVAELWDKDCVASWRAETRTSPDNALVKGHLAAISRRLGLAGQPPYLERALRHAGILRDAPVFGRHPAPLRGLRDRAALWLLAKV